MSGQTPSNSDPNPYSASNAITPTDASTTGDVALPQGREFLGHPLGLFLLFMVEMWERFSYYGMRALLIFYLTKHWLYSKADAGIIYGAYTSLVYITPVLGGYLADRFLGQRKAVLFGAVLLTFGHVLMGFEGSGGVADASGAVTDRPGLNMFWLALSFIIVGSGFLKANISVIVGQLYPRTDVRRDGAYTIFYMGINLGAALGSLLCGYLGEKVGWSYGFGAAGIGMLLGLVLFVIGRPLLLGRGESPDSAKLKQSVAGLKLEYALYAIGVLSVGLIWVLIQYQKLVGNILGVSGAALAGYVVYVAVMKLTSEERDRIFAALILMTGSILFWALFEQAGSSLNLYTDSYVDRWGIPASVFQSVNAIYIVLLAPLFAALWTKLGRAKLEPSAPAKFGYALIQLGFGFLILDWGARGVGLQNMTPVIFIFLLYLFHTTGELCLSPVGLSAMNRLAPKHLASLIMGTWFFASAIGNFAAGVIASATGSEEKLKELEKLSEAAKPAAGAVAEAGAAEAAADLAAQTAIAGKQVVLEVYTQIGWLTILVGVGVLVVSPLIKKLMHLDTLKNDTEAAAH